MPNQIEYKRVTKNVLISELTVFALLFFGYGILLDWKDWIMFPVWGGLYIFFLLLYAYALDKKMKPILITPIFLFVSVCLQTFLFFVLSNHSMPLVLNLSIVLGLFLANVIGAFKQIGYPPYVVDGKYTIEDEKKYAIQQFKKMILILGIILVFFILFYLVLLLWKNTHL